MPALQNEAYTVEDIYSLPDGQRAELIDEELEIDFSELL